MFVTNSVDVDVRVVREAFTLVQAGHEVAVVGLRDGEQAAEDTLEGFRVVRVGRDRIHRPGAGLLAMAATLAGYALGSLRRGLARRFDVYHAHDLPTLPLAWVAARVRGGRLVYDAHELFTEIGRLPAPLRLLLGLVERQFARRADRVITRSDSIAGELARRYALNPPVVLRNYPRTGGRVPTREESPLRARADIPPDIPLVLYQGVFVPQRGLDTLVRAAGRFRRARLVLLGWGPLEAALRELARAHGLEGRVRFLQRVPQTELLAYTAGADLGVVPYSNVGLNNYYASPNKLFEYCVAGVPVVASRLPDLTRVVEGLGIGRTFDTEDPADIARTVDALVEDPVALAQARERVRSVAGDFTWERESARLLEVYAGLRANR